MKTRLYIVRHGIAHDIGDHGIRSDFERTLSPKGYQQIRSVAEGLRRLGTAPVLIATSPLPRAAQTARAIGDLLDPGIPILELDALRPGKTVETALAWLRHPGVAGDIMMVGHMPDVAILAACLLCPAGEVELPFGKAAVCGIRFEGLIRPGSGRLHFFLQARQFRLLREPVPFATK